MKTIVYILLGTLMLCLQKLYVGTTTGFICQDPKLSFSYHGDTITFFKLLLVNFIGTFLIITIVELYKEINGNKFLKKWYFEYLLGFLIHSAFLSMIKTIFPEHRPHFLESCRPDTGLNCKPGEYITTYKCTNTTISTVLLMDSKRSFPSGHTSEVVYTSLFCGSYIYYRLSSHEVNRLVKQLAITTIAAWCLICSVTRITDHRHHWWDVGFGVLFGLISAVYQNLMMEIQDEPSEKLSIKEKSVFWTRNKQKWLMRTVNFIILLAIMACMILIRPRTRNGFFCQDPTLAFPFYGDTVTFATLLSVCFLGTTSIIFLVELHHQKRIDKTWFKFFVKWLCEYFLGFLIHCILLNVFKSLLSEKRPHFFDSCLPDTGFNCIPGEYVKDYLCTNKDTSKFLISDSQRSFPSGHASTSVYTSVFCACYVHYRFNCKLFNALIKPLIITAIIAWCAVCSLTRLTDNRHHWWDVVFGVTFGLINATYQVFGRCKTFQEAKNLSERDDKPRGYQIINQTTTNIIV